MRARTSSVYCDGIERVGRLLLDQLLRELQLGGLHVGLRDLDVLDRPHLAGVEELLHDQAVLDRADHHDVLLAARGPAAERAALRLAQRLREQRVRLGAALVGREVVGLVEVHRVDRLDRHELGDLGLCVPASSIAFSSSGVNITYWSFANS